MARKYFQDKIPPQFRKWLKVSTGVHIIFLIVLIVGLPRFLQDDTPVIPRIIPVDIVDISEVTNTRVAEKNDPSPTPAPQAAPQKPLPPPQPETPEKKAEPKPDPKAEALPDKKKPPEKKEEKKKEEKKEEKKEPPKNLLSSVLKNVQKMKDDIKPAPVVPNAPVAETPVNTQEAPALAQQLSISEMDALRRQIQQCWNVPVGARGVETMNVEIYVEVNEDRTVRRADIVDTLRMTTDPFFRTVAESARRALFNPRCIPLMLPPERYSQWKTIRMNFNPAEMF
ncbi:MAG: hypothetical protein AB7G06_04465 [Bdellovibrionales bacterium]